MDTHKALALLREAPTRFAIQGTVVASWRTYRGRRLGPYYRLAWRENGRQRSIYLGRQSPLVEEARHLLHEAQTIRRMLAEHRRRQAEFKKYVIRPLQQYVKEMFRLFGNGLYVKGSDIGGIKTAGPRLTTADVPEHLIPKFPLPMPSFLTELHPQPEANTNPNREREQKTPSPNEAPKRRRTHQASTSNTHPYRRPTEFRDPVDQNPSRLPAINPSLIQPALPPKHRVPEFPKSVDQKHPHTARGPPMQSIRSTMHVSKRVATRREQATPASTACVLTDYPRAHGMPYNPGEAFSSSS